MTDENEKPQPSGKDLPASVVFMELMRRVASRNSPPDVETDTAETTDEDVIPLEQAQSSTNAPAQAKAESRPASMPHKPAMTDEERQQAAALQAQRLKRVQRRKEERQVRRVGLFGGILRAFLLVGVSATLMATILSWWTDANFLRPEMRRNLQAALNLATPTPIPTIAPTPNFFRKIGVVSGHRGPGQEAPYDPGAVCDFGGLTENEINFNVAVIVVNELRARGYTAELLDEFDPRLVNYKADALVSIHANTCADFGEFVSGFLVAKADAKPEGGPDTRLAECIATYYGVITGLERRTGLTKDMTDYHSFREIDPLTSAAIIELGFMLADTQILTEEPDRLARGIVEGVVCFLDPQNAILEPLNPTIEP